MIAGSKKFEKLNNLKCVNMKMVKILSNSSEKNIKTKPHIGY